jgi:hypothetical protein
VVLLQIQAVLQPSSLNGCAECSATPNRRTYSVVLLNSIKSSGLEQGWGASTEMRYANSADGKLSSAGLREYVPDGSSSEILYKGA